MIWPMVIIKTRGREIIWHCILPSPYSQVVSVFCHSNIFFIRESLQQIVAKLVVKIFKVFIMPNVFKHTQYPKGMWSLKVVSVRILCVAQTICLDYLSEFGHLDNETKSSL